MLGSYWLSFSVNYYKKNRVPSEDSFIEGFGLSFYVSLVAVWFFLHAMLEVDYEQLLAHLGIAFGNPQNGLPHPDLAQACMRALGPNGEGVVAVRGMKDYESLRGRLLQLAHKLALLPHPQRLKILKVVDIHPSLHHTNITSVNVVVRIPNPMISNRYEVGLCG